VLLGESQVKISKHLNYLKTRGLVIATREANWMIYSLPADPTHELRANLSCLQDCAQENEVFRRDSSKLKKLRSKFEADAPLCCAPKSLILKPLAK
jgi:ArsR family transcriptional regulator